MSKPRHPADFANDDAPYVVELENSLRKLLGDADVDAFFSHEKILSCKEVMKEAQAGLYEDAMQIFEGLNAAYMKIQKHPERAGREAQRMDNICIELRGRMEDIGMTLGCRVAHSLHDCLHYPINESSLVVIGKHVEVLTVILKRKILGDEGAAGQEMMAILAKLTRKVRH